MKIHVARTDAQQEEVHKQESRQTVLHSVVEELKLEHIRIWKESDEAKAKIANAENQNRNLKQQLSTAEKELQKLVADRDSLATALGAVVQALLLLWDPDAFFDSIHWTELIPLARMAGYSAVLLLLGWQVHYVGCRAPQRHRGPLQFGQSKRLPSIKRINGAI